MLQPLNLFEGANQLKCTARAQGLTAEIQAEFGIHNIESKQPDTSPGLFLDYHKTTHYLVKIIIVFYDPGGIVTWSVFTTTFRPTVVFDLLDTMKPNNSQSTA
jgi:hypothetical protein